jgi:sialate O-acetylesterase
MRLLPLFSCGVIWSASLLALRADVKLPAILGPNMVLQCDQPLPIWGWAEAGEKVTVECSGQHVETTAGANGTWRVTLAPLPAGGPVTMTVSGHNRLVLENILVGEVWLCSGQSNMTLRVDQADRAKEEIAAAKFPKIRLFTVKRAVAESGPQADCQGKWEECSPRTVGTFTAVGYYFGRDLFQSLGRPVGLIHSSWGGTKAEAWTPRTALVADAVLQPIVRHWADEMAAFPQKKADFDRDHVKLEAEWKLAVEKAEAEGRMPPAQPLLRTGPNTQYAPSGLYNAMIAPLATVGLRGVIWYQGEANVGAPQQYQRLFPALITSWRAAWNRPDLPFLFVQLPNLARQAEPSKSGWAEMREAQLKTLALPNTGMAVTIDVGDPKNLHPTHKQPVGHRLALVAETLVYHHESEGGLSPLPAGSEAQGNSIRVKFKPANSGLMASDGKPLRGFVIAGSDKKFVPADATIEGDTVIVQSDSVAQPVAVRYAWADNPDCNLANRAGLPASPFRTDDWIPMVHDALPGAAAK